MGELVAVNEPLIENTHLINLKSHPVEITLDILLQDKTTKKNIIWATDIYHSHGSNCSDISRITREAFTMINPVILQPRTEKALEQQQERTRKKAEVFTPVWLCNKMNNCLDREWFGREDVFNHENDDNTWTVIEEKITFPDGKTWKEYVDSRRLEITCGEAPYLVSRYDAANGEFILPPLKRIGILDRKIRIVNENAESKEEWIKWVERAFQSCYGYEYQGDSLLIARINLLMSFADYYAEKWNENPDDTLLKKIANIIAWNTWQMDGLKDTVPFGKPYQQYRQVTLFDSFEKTEKQEEDVALPCKIYDWRRDNSLLFKDCKKRGKMSKKMFDFVIGNPPYQENQDATSDTPVYNYLMDSSYNIANSVELITPGRFLFDAGKTPKIWNKKMLNDPHFKVLQYYQDGSAVFPGTGIRGGVVVTYRDAEKNFGPIGTFTIFEELNSIKNKVHSSNFESLSSIVYAPESFRFADKMLEDHPEIPFRSDGKKGNLGILSKGHDYDIVTNIFDKLNNIVFFNKPINDGYDYIKFIGRKDNNRVEMYIRSDYINNTTNLKKYKVILPKSNGGGTLGETLSTPLVGEPFVGHTQTFLSIGSFNTYDEANNCLKYIKTKFARALLGIKKVTQDNKRNVWEYVPLQDFTTESDIDWSKSIQNIDRQLYSKYQLSIKEMEFVESHIQEMD